jgi:hypothetical protein
MYLQSFSGYRIDFRRFAVSESADEPKHTIVKRSIFDKVTSIATLILSSATVVVALIAYRQVGIMEADQRPWIGMGTVGPVPTPEFLSTGGHFDLEVVNTGKSPAIGVTITLLKWNTDINTVQFPLNRCASECRIENGALIPGARLGMLIPDSETPPMPKAGDTGYVIARVDYQEANGTPHVTEICYKIITTAPSPLTNNRLAVSTTSCAAPNSNSAS